MKLVIYNFFILILIPVFVLRIFVKSFTDPDYTKLFLNRFGYNFSEFKQSNKKIIWFHAVSLGEVIGSQMLINKLAEHFDIVITTSTPTGLRRAKELFSADIAINYAPWDFVFFINANNKEDAKALCDSMGFIQAELMSYEVIPVGVFWLGDSQEN